MHDREDYLSPLTGYQARYYKNGVLRKTVNPVWPSQQYGGSAVESGRAASAHTTADKYGWRAPTSYDAKRNTEAVPPLTYSFRTDVGFYGGENHIDSRVDPGLPDSDLMAQLSSEAKTLCLAKFGSGSVDLSVAFIERKKTAGMIADWCAATTRLLRDLKKGRWITHYRNSSTKTWKWDKNVPRGWTPKAVSQWRAGEPVTAVKNAWLTTRYGIAPSLMDIAGSVEALENADNGTFERYIVTNRSRRFKAESYSTLTENRSFGRYYVLPSVNTRTNYYSKQEVMVRIDATIDDSFYLTLQDVGLTNPLLTGWEITPYSFVLDWFVGVGDFLAAVNAWNTGYVFKAGSETRYWKRDAKRHFSINDVPGYYDQTISGGDGPQRANEGFTRSVFTSSPLPEIVVKRDPLNFERMWDSIFLLSNVLGSKGHANKAASRARNLRV